MANGIKAARQIQMSRETTQGAPSATFYNWRGMGVLEDVREMVMPDEDVGKISGTDRQYCPKTGGKLELEEVELTFEQIPHILDAAIKYVAPSADSSGSGYVRQYEFPVDSSDIVESSDLQTYSFKTGDNNEVEKASFGFVTDFKLSAAAGEAWKITSNWETREVLSDSDGFAASPILQTVEEALLGNTYLYIDDSSDTPGTTLISNTLIGAEIDFNPTGWMSVFTGSGRLDFSFIKQVRPEIKMSITFEHNATASLEKSAWRVTEKARNIRLYIAGSALAVPGIYANKLIIIDLAGKWETFEKLDENDGNDVVTGNFIARYNSVADLFNSIIVVNEVGAL